MRQIVHFWSEHHTTDDVPVPDVLAQAKDVPLTQVVVIGRTEEGFFFTSSEGSAQEIMWLLRVAEAKLMSMAIT